MFEFQHLKRTEFLMDAVIDQSSDGHIFKCASFKKIFTTSKFDMMKIINDLKMSNEHDQFAMKIQIKMKDQWQAVDAFAFDVKTQENNWLLTLSLIERGFQNLIASIPNHETREIMNNDVNECKCMYGRLDNFMCESCILLNGCWKLLPGDFSDEKKGPCKRCNLSIKKCGFISIKHVICPIMSTSLICWACMDDENFRHSYRLLFRPCLMCGAETCRCYIFYPFRHCFFETVLVFILNNRLVELGRFPSRFASKFINVPSNFCMRPFRICETDIFHSLRFIEFPFP
jgi:hypothetical protein